MDKDKQVNMEAEQQDGGSTEKPKLHSAAALIWETAKIVVVALIIAIVLNNFIVANMEVSTGSMETTVMTGDRIIFNRLAYLGRGPQRYDVVVFKYPYGNNENYVKRVIGLPGEKVEIIDGRVYINDSPEPLDDSFASFLPQGDYGPYEVPEGEYFMLGDNREHSHDSRYWPNPYIEENKIIGKALLRYYPNLKLM